MVSKEFDVKVNLDHFKGVLEKSQVQKKPLVEKRENISVSKSYATQKANL